MTMPKYKVYGIDNETEDMYELSYSDLELMQYTGVIDINSVDVYHGYIVKYNDGEDEFMDCTAFDGSISFVDRPPHDFGCNKFERRHHNEK